MKQSGINKSFSFGDILLICAGIFIMALGSACSYEADVGTGSIGTMVDGVHSLLSISQGLADIAVSLALLLPMFFFSRDLIGIGTLISLFGVGLSVDFWKMLLTPLALDGIAARAVLYALGAVLGSLGSAIYITVGAGISSYDAALMLSYRLTGWQYANASILANFAMLLIGWLCGGTVGIGTVLTTVLGGYISQFFLSRCYRWMGKPSPLARAQDDSRQDDAPAL